MVKSFIRGFLRAIYARGELPILFGYDFYRFFRYYSREQSGKDRYQLRSWILQDAHRIEKAVSLPTPRAGFGERVVARLAKNVSTYARGHGSDETYRVGVGALRLYQTFHEQQDLPLPAFFRSHTSILLGCPPDLGGSFVGLKALEASSISFSEFSRFFRSRSSCRRFAPDRPVDPQLLEDLVETCIRTPSVCNRQHWRVRFFSGRAKAVLLSLQNGNSGFGSDAPILAVVTSDLRAFYAPSERYQAFVDGGMFAMAFLLSCHAAGLGACALNWSAPLAADLRIHRWGFIPSAESVIMMIAIGHSANDCLVASSPRLHGQAASVRDAGLTEGFSTFAPGSADEAEGTRGEHPTTSPL